MNIGERYHAMALGRSHYFTGKPCKRGHIALRHISGHCMVCHRLLQASPHYLAKRRERRAVRP